MQPQYSNSFPQKAIRNASTMQHAGGKMDRLAKSYLQAGSNSVKPSPQKLAPAGSKWAYA